MNKAAFSARDCTIENIIAELENRDIRWLREHFFIGDEDLVKRFSASALLDPLRKKPLIQTVISLMNPEKYSEIRTKLIDLKSKELGCNQTAIFCNLNGFSKKYCFPVREDSISEFIEFVDVTLPMGEFVAKSASIVPYIDSAIFIFNENDVYDIYAKINCLIVGLGKDKVRLVIGNTITSDDEKLMNTIGIEISRGLLLIKHIEEIMKNSSISTKGES